VAGGRGPGGGGILVVAAERPHGRALAAAPDGTPSAETLHARLAALISFYQWQEAVHSVPVAGRLLRGRAARMPSRGLLAHLDARREPGPSSLVKVRRNGPGRPPLLLPQEIQAIIDGCATWDEAAGEWRGNLRDRLLFSLLAESGMRLGEVLGMAISDFVMGRGGTAYIEVAPRAGNPNGARAKMMRPRRIYVSADLERLFADYLTHLACRAAGLGMTVSPGSPLLVNLDRPPLLAAIREGTGRDKVTALKNKGIGPAGWTPHWFRHSHASALLLAGNPEWVVSRRLGHAMCRPPSTCMGTLGNCISRERNRRSAGHGRVGMARPASARRAVRRPARVRAAHADPRPARA
jgi:integrase